MAGKGRPAKSGSAKKVQVAPVEGGVVKKNYLAVKVPKENRLQVFIYKVLKQVHPDCGINKATMNILNDLALEVFRKITHNAAELSRHGGKNHLKAQDIQSAIRLTVPGELAKHAVNESTRAVTQFTNSKKN